MDHCDICKYEDKPLINICGTLLCAECEEFERTADIESYEQEKRERITEENEN